MCFAKLCISVKSFLAPKELGLRRHLGKLTAGFTERSEHCRFGSLIASCYGSKLGWKKLLGWCSELADALISAALRIWGMKLQICNSGKKMRDCSVPLIARIRGQNSFFHRGFIFK